MPHSAAPLALAWLLGLGLSLRHRRRGLATFFGLTLATMVLSLLPGLWELNALLKAEHWLALAVLVLATGHRGPAGPGLTSLLPLLLAGQSMGALLLGVIIAGKGLLEAGAPGRGWLATALLLLATASVMDDQLLRLWDLCVRTTGMGADPASLLVRLLAEAFRLAGWGAMLRWSVPRNASRPRRQRRG
jgi:hypothetical protein